MNYGGNWIVFGIVVLAIFLHISLTVTGEEDFIRLKFGPGLIRKTFRYNDIASCMVVRNHWLYGWGIRKLPKGWLFNVSGLDAVELSMKNEKVYRIGTDEPHALCEFIRNKLNENT